MRLHAITDRRLFGGDESGQCAALAARAMAWAQGGVGGITLREKDLADEAFEALATKMIRVVRDRGVGARGTLLLVSGRPEIARRIGADGVHVASAATAGSSVAARMQEAAEAWGGAALYVSVSCHTVEEVREARELGAAQVVFAPVFEKPLPGGGLPGVGLEALQAACEAAGGVPVFALGGVTAENAGACIAAGAAGVAGVRLFVGDGWRGLVGG